MPPFMSRASTTCCIKGKNYELDVAWCFHSDYDDAFTYITLKDQPLKCLISADNKLSKKEFLHWSDLKDEPFVSTGKMKFSRTSSGSTVRSLALCHMRNFSPRTRPLSPSWLIKTRRLFCSMKTSSTVFVSCAQIQRLWRSGRSSMCASPCLSARTESGQKYSIFSLNTLK